MMRCNWPKWLFPWAILPLGLGAAALLFNSDSLESELKAAAESQLSSGGAGWAAVSMDGRDAKLSGEAPEQDAVARAAQLVAGTYGVRRVDSSGVTVAPPVSLDPPTVNSISGLSGTPEITGTWPQGKAATLAVGLAGTTYELGKNAELSSDGSGNWKLVPSTALAPGNYDVNVKVTDGNKAEASVSVPGAVTVEAPPPAPAPSAPEEPTVSAVSGFGNTPTISGTWPEADGNALTVGLAGKDYKLGTDAELASDGSGNWKLTPSSSLADGVYDVTATVTNAASLSSTATLNGAVRVDTTPPQAPTVEPVSSRAVRPAIAGTWPEGDAKQLTVTIADKTYTLGTDGQLTSDGSGNWTLKLDTDLADNTYDVVATATDEAGNSASDRGFGEVVVDASAPAVPTVNTTLTRQRQPVLTGAWPSKDAASLTVKVGDKTYTADAGDGLVTDGDNWTLRLSENLPDGTYNVVATVTDKAGNAASDESDAELTVDATPPAVPTVNSYKSEFPRPLLSGTFPENEAETMAVTFAGETFAKGSSPNLSTDGRGNWSILTSKDYEPGTYDVKVVVADKAGNQRSDTTTNEVEIVAPAKPAEPEPAPVPAVDCQKLFDEALADRDIEFDSARATIRSSSNDLLDKLADVIRQCPDAKVEIGGHTDATGSTSYNQALSERRAVAVRDALIARGADAANLTAVGYGESRPIADNNTREGRARNRRTEFKVQP